ncbi:MAG: GAF domain-containing protein, partial [Dehalococcoidia bacterium]
MLLGRKLETPPLREEPSRTFSFVALGVTLVGLGYLAILIFTALLTPYRFPIPYAVPIFDTPFVLVAIGVGYLCLARHRVREDSRSAFLGTSLWLAALLGLGHILTQPDYPGTPTVHAGVAPYFFLLSCAVGFAGIGLAVHYGDRELPLGDRGRFRIGLGSFVLSVLVVIIVFQLRPLLPSLVMPPGRLTPFAIGLGGVCCGLVGMWALWGGAQKVFGKTWDWFAGYLMLATLIWLLGLTGFLIFPFRYGISWYLAGLSRPIGVGVIFVGLLWEQVWLYQEARARQRDLEALHTAGQALVTSLDPHQIVEAIATKGLEVCGAQSAILFRLDPQAQVLRAVGHAGQVSQELVSTLVLPVGTGVAGVSVAERRPAWTSNIQVDDRIQLASEIRERVGQEGFKAVLVIPLLIKSGEVFGALSVGYREERDFTDADVELLLAFGTQVSVAIENARSFDELALKGRHDSALQSLGQRLLEATGEEAILTEALGVTQDLVEADYVGVFLFDPKAGRLRMKAGVGWGPGTVGVVEVPPSVELLVGHAFVHKEILQVEDLTRDHRFSTPSYLAAHGVQAGLFVPLGLGDQPAGVIGVCYRMPHRFSGEEIRILVSIAHQAALALEKAHLYAELQANLQRLQETQDQLIQA